jgi:hypothetical protein
MNIETIEETIVSSGTMYIGLNTDVFEVLEVHAPQIPDNAKKQIYITLEKLLAYRLKYGCAAPNQLNLLDEIEVSKKTFYMSFDSTAADVLETYAPQLPAVVKEQIGITVDKIIEQRIESGRVSKFSDRVKSLGIEVRNVYVPRHIKEAIETIADGMYAEGKANLMGLTRNDINELKKKWDRDLINDLRDLLNQNLVDIYENEPLVLPFFLGHMGEKQYTKEKLLRLLSQGKISAPRIEAMLEAIKKEYKVWNEEDELEAFTINDN